MPGYIIGPNRLAKDASKAASGSNAIVMNIILGVKTESARPFAISDLRDVARIHVESLDESKVPGNKNFFVHPDDAPGQKTGFGDAEGIARKLFSDAVKDGRLPLGGQLGVVDVHMDGRETVRVFGKLRGFEDAVANLLEQYLELLGKS